jgi:DNA-binding response OmpR family regulator
VVKYLEGQQPYANREIFPFPNLLLLDAGLPIMTGFQVLRSVRERFPVESLPVVILTNSMAARELESALKLGVDSCAIKPTGFDELRKLLDELVERWVYERQLSQAA